jgi:membrane AbrB-like protein
MYRLLLTVTVGLLGGLLFRRLKIPGGMLVGAIVGVAVLNITTQAATMPLYAKDIAQITVGAYIGCGINREDVAHLPRIAGPLAVMLGAFLLLNMAVGFIIHAISPMDLLTSLLCAMPGGLTDTPLIAMDLGADVPKVAVMQLIRMIFGLAVLPSFVVLFDGMASRRSPRKKQTEPADCARPPAPEACQVTAETCAPVCACETTCQDPPPRPNTPNTTVSVLLTLTIAAAGGIVGKRLNIPAGVLLFAILSVALTNVFFHKTCLPMWCRRLAQVLSGSVIGSQIAFDDLLEMRRLALPAVVMVAGYIINSIGTGYLLSRIFSMSRREGMLYTSPAGATEMALIAADLGVDSPDMMLTQIVRLLAVMALHPHIFLWVVRLMS